MTPQQLQIPLGARSYSARKLQRLTQNLSEIDHLSCRHLHPIFNYELQHIRALFRDSNLSQGPHFIYSAYIRVDIYLTGFEHNHHHIKGPMYCCKGEARDCITKSDTLY